jgi:hypothetical protein
MERVHSVCIHPSYTARPRCMESAMGFLKDLERLLGEIVCVCVCVGVC